MTMDNPSVGRRVRQVLACVGVLALVGCTPPSSPTDRSSPIGGGTGGSPTVAPSPTARAARPAADPEPTTSAADCPAGRWRLRATEPTPGGAVENIRFSGRDAFDLTFADGGWRLSGNRKALLKATIEIGGFPVSGTATIDGTARGRYRMVKSVAVFRLERTAGDVAVAYPGGRQTYGMEPLAGALVPDGAADITCRGDTLRIEAENLTLDLKRVRR
jgi:hypothetical protein